MAISHNHSHMDGFLPPLSYTHCAHHRTHCSDQNRAIQCHHHDAQSFLWPWEKRRGLIFIMQSRAKHERPAERKHIKVTDLWPKKHSQPHSTQLQTPENACRGSPARASWGFVSYALKYVCIAIKVWYCASWQQRPPPVTIWAAGRFTSDSI